MHQWIYQSDMYTIDAIVQFFIKKISKIERKFSIIQVFFGLFFKYAII